MEGSLEEDGNPLESGDSGGDSGEKILLQRIRDWERGNFCDDDTNDNIGEEMKANENFDTYTIDVRMSPTTTNLPLLAANPSATQNPKHLPKLQPPPPT